MMITTTTMFVSVISEKLKKYKMTKREKELNDAMKSLLTAMRGLTITEALRILRTIKERVTTTATVAEDTRFMDIAGYKNVEYPLVEIKD